MAVSSSRHFPHAVAVGYFRPHAMSKGSKCASEVNVLDGLATAAGGSYCGRERGKVGRRFNLSLIFNEATKGPSAYYIPQNAFTISE